ncbi:MAG: fumarylacetoacetate hydrolase family protein [Gammaproteobacteria bacterium]|nr:MAG: fumarylacetoacetate hydrolase family protein [Gammaproteobacteria bacterium]RLA51011.1 MAG: fumarylacetoacetate hydrolase family protein [Gammaproteobacteria bacterium]
MSTNYYHQFLDGSPCGLPAGKVVCVGLNYAAHIQEMASQKSAEPMLFIKPTSALTSLASPLLIPQGLGSVHFETEMAILIGQELNQCSEPDVLPAIGGIGIALDLTLRDLQKQLRDVGHPWEKAKGWDGACPVSAFLKPDKITDLQNVSLSLEKNGDIQQDGNTAQMLTPVIPLIAYMSRFFTLHPGDVVLTGTPEGVGPIVPGDSLVVALNDVLSVAVTDIRYRSSS